VPSTTKADDLTISFPPHRGVGISKSALWASWKEVRKRVRDSSWRDIIDFAEFDIEPDKWIAQLLSDLRSGRYQPQHPRRFPLAKSKGFSRWMTLPDMRDVALYHCIATKMAGRAERSRKKPRHVYFMRDRIAKIQEEAEQEAKAEGAAGYLSPGQSGFRNWLRMHQYRRLLIFKKVYPYIVKTDISNFFDSIAHSQVEAFLYELGFSRNIIGLLLLLLERLSIRDAYAGAPRIGLPVDEFDCSRCLAHVVLFPHDDRMVELVGEDAYVRWMDDQDFGLKSLGGCYRLLAEINASLRRMHLTPNSAKTKILTVAQARREFHFVTNDRLDKIDAVLKKNRVSKAVAKARKDFASVWSQAQRDEGVGEWGKIVKRCYRLAGRLKLRTLLRAAHEHVLSDPSLAEYIAPYLRAVCPVPEVVERMDAMLTDERNVYDDVKRILAEELLRLEPKDRAEQKLLRASVITQNRPLKIT
jgi:hypothetical protein